MRRVTVLPRIIAKKNTSHTTHQVNQVIAVSCGEKVDSVSLALSIALLRCYICFLRDVKIASSLKL